MSLNRTVHRVDTYVVYGAPVFDARAGLEGLSVSVSLEYGHHHSRRYQGAWRGSNYPTDGGPTGHLSRSRMTYLLWVIGIKPNLMGHFLSPCRCMSDGPGDHTFTGTCLKPHPLYNPALLRFARIVYLDVAFGIQELCPLAARTKPPSELTALQDAR